MKALQINILRPAKIEFLNNLPKIPFFAILENSILVQKYQLLWIRNNRSLFKTNN